MRSGGEEDAVASFVVVQQGLLLGWCEARRCAPGVAMLVLQRTTCQWLLQGPALNNARIVPDVVDQVNLDKAVSLRIQYGDRTVANGNELAPAEACHSCCIVTACTCRPHVLVAVASVGARSSVSAVAWNRCS